MNTEQIAITTEEELNEMRMCGDCLGRGRIRHEYCAGCDGKGRVLTVRARMLRQQRAERLAKAAPALYEAAQAALKYIEDENPGAAACDAWVAGICDRLRAALSLVDAPKETK